MLDTARQDRWAQHIGIGSGTHTAVRLMEQGLAPGTRRAYGGHWAAFEDFCLSAKPAPLEPLPASTGTVVRYIGFVAEQGNVAATSMQPYLSAINAVHRDFGFEAPALGHMVTRVRGGMATAQAELYKTDARTQLAAEHMEKALLRALETPEDLDLLRAAAYAGTQYQFAHREGSTVFMQPDDISFDNSEVWLRERVRKGHRKTATMRIMRQPLAGLPAVFTDVMELFDMIQTADGDPNRKFYFALSGEGTSGWTATKGDEWLQELLNAANIKAPPGFKYTSHSLRSGAATAMHSIGVHLTKICHYGGWAATSTAVHDYIDVAFPPSAAARRFFGWLL